MSPLDDQLHDALHGRAAVITPPADPMAGIERRARGIRRRRLAASVAGAALVISGVAVVVPSLLPQQSAVAPTNPRPSQTVTDESIDPTRAWPMRGELSPAARTALQAAWTAKHPTSTPNVLFGQTYEPSARQEAVFVAAGDDGPRYGFATISGTSVDLVVDEPLAARTQALAFALPGDEVPRLIVVASPSSKDVAYSKDGTAFASIARDTGIGITALEGDTTRDRVRITTNAGEVSYDEPAPDFGAQGGPPANALTDWPTRGAMESNVLAEAKDAWAAGLGTTAEQLEVKILFASDTDSGVEYVMGQAWAPGKPAHNVAYSEGGTNGPQPFIGVETPKDPAVLAFLVSSLPGTSTDELVVIPQPQTGQVFYDKDASGAFTPITGQNYLDGVVIIDRSRTATDDRLELFDGDGDLDNPTYRGPVRPLLCGVRECG